MSRRTACFGLVLGAIVCVLGEFVEPPFSLSLRSIAEAETRLPCRFQVQQEQVVQVSWTRERADGTKEQIITAHRTEGHTEFGRFVGRVRFESTEPTRDSTLLILSTQESDEGSYTCHITTFPSGNFDRQITLTVWTLPISSLEPVVLKEGQSFRIAASCRSVARPQPRLSWDTDLPGQSQNRSSDGGVVTSYFSLHPLRSMNGRQLDCLVWHPALQRPRRISNRLVVHFPPDAALTGYDGSWSVGLTGAELNCESGGNPKAHNYTWTRRGGVLPEGVSVEGARLVFGRPLILTDGGVYECEVRNSMGAEKTEVDITVADARSKDPPFNSLLMIIVGGVAGALVVIMVIIIILVNLHHRRKNRKLKRELSERTVEINNLSRQASLRRLNSVSTDPRIQTEDCTLMRLDSTMKNSVLSLEERSTLCGQRGELDSLGLAPIYQPYRTERESMRRQMEEEKEEHRRREESYLKSSNMSLDSGLPSSLVPMKCQPDQEAPGMGSREQSPPPLSTSPGPPREKEREGVAKKEGWGMREGVTEREGWGRREGVTEGEEGDCAAHTYEISEALSNHFHYSNGFLRPKPHPNSILLHPRGQII